MKNRIFFTVICLLCLSVPANAQYDTLQNYPYLYTKSWQDIGVYHNGELCNVYDYVYYIGNTSNYFNIDTVLITELAVLEQTNEPLKVIGIATGNHANGTFIRMHYTLYGSDMEILSVIETDGFGLPSEWDSNYHLFEVPGKNDWCRGTISPFHQYTQMTLKFCFFDNPIIIDPGDYFIGCREESQVLMPSISYIIEEHNPPYHIDPCPIRLFDKENKVWLDDTLERERPELFLIIDPDYHGVSGIPEIETPNPTIEIYPNPATEQVEVTSSLPMARIVATDALGHRLLDRPATGLKATLDVSRWPAGAYLLQVHTATGIASRKLLVQ